MIGNPHYEVHFAHAGRSSPGNGLNPSDAYIAALSSLIEACQVWQATTMASSDEVMTRIRKDLVQRLANAGLMWHALKACSEDTDWGFAWNKEERYIIYCIGSNPCKAKYHVQSQANWRYP